MNKNIKKAVEDFNSEVKDSEKIIIGVKAHKAESKEELKKRLKSIAEYSCDHFLSTGAMCYSPAHTEARIYTNICPHCGRMYQYGLYTYVDSRHNPHEIIQKKISEIVNEIKKIGYDIQVEHMCGFCYQQEYGKAPIHIEYSCEYESEEENLECESEKVYERILESNDSVSVLSFRFKSTDEYTRNIVSLEDCELMLDFLNGNNAYVGDRDEIHMLTDCCELIKHLLGL
ncbi:hypothetical protein SAMN02745213_00511 [Succinivibrio dextrinosolvens DSM 3072]|uniref:Uncharacterized protein n=1 Tax=Succinivibrio dextrinosolvens DSM 3072 TaxID=1123324 RepID=A0A1T4V1D5_9GAMM|nr:hypothetical protein [Succinivibrio dextrinosolvens]SKA58688.1 hypothetical protein SAMN02745213_00511 [Succinivibrio dextrinosolvens DSM 3072]